MTARRGVTVGVPSAHRRRSRRYSVALGWRRPRGARGSAPHATPDARRAGPAAELSRNWPRAPRGPVARAGQSLPLTFGDGSASGGWSGESDHGQAGRDCSLSHDLRRSGSAKQFGERLKSSIEEIGLSEPIKVTPLPEGELPRHRRHDATAGRAGDPQEAAGAVPNDPRYVFDYERRFEIRYQSDIYQDLLPSQLAVLVEHLHRAEHVSKIDIARYIGVSPATLRNYTGLWRLLQRGTLFAKIVDLIDVEVIPSSNPYAWLRLTANGLRKVIEDNFSEGEPAETWIEQTIKRARQGDKQGSRSSW